jgi:hypothetical protein
MREAIAEMLLDKTTGFFDWWNREDRVDLYQTGVGWPLLTTTINGFGIAAPWFPAFGKSRADTLFLALGHISRSWSGFYIKHQDDAYAEVSWARTLEAETTLGSQLLEEFASNPADQMGSSFLGLYAGEPKHMVLFTYAPAEFFRISLFGEMRDRVPEALRRAAG